MTTQGFSMKHTLIIATIFIGSLLTLSTGRADDVAVKTGNSANPANTSVAVAVSQGSARNALEDKFRMALIEEETGQQLDTAIQAYKEVIAGLDDQRKMAVTAIFHLGECYRKQGKTNEAVAQFERILRDFSEQKVVLDFAQRRFAELSPGGSGKAPMQVPGLADETGAATAEEADEIQKIRDIIKNSPDLINAREGGDHLSSGPLPRVIWRWSNF
jgi:tetratricopeptide (TPR) repeat protein